MVTPAREPARAPLRGLRVAITRPAGDEAGFAALLRDRGAEPVVAPLVRIEAAGDAAALQAAAAAMDSYDWIVFTSANAVRCFREALPAGAATAADRPRVAAVGPATADAVAEQLGWRVAAMPDRYVGAAVAAAMAAVAPLAGARVLWPKAVEARDTLARRLSGAGARLHAVDAYRTLPVPAAAAELALQIGRGDVDVVTLTSPSAARCLAEVRPTLGGVVVAVIGPSTAQAARAAGLPVHVEPEVHTIPGLVDELSRHFARAGAPPAANHETGA